MPVTWSSTVPTLAVAGALGLAVTPAAASGPASWRVPEACGGAAALTARVTEQAGRRLGPDEPVAIDVTIRADDGGYRAAVDLVSSEGAAHREVAGADCSTVLDAVALLVAVAVAEAAPAEVASDVARPRPPSAPTWLRVGAAVGIDVGALPEAAPGTGLWVAIGRDRWRVELGGDIYRAAFAALPGEPMRGVEVGLLAGRIRGCRGLGPLDLCAGVAVGRLEGRPVELAQPSTESRRWSAVTAGLGWSRRLAGRFVLGAAVDGVLTLDRPEFILADDTRLHQPAAGGVRAGAGLEVEIR